VEYERNKDVIDEMKPGHGSEERRARDGDGVLVASVHANTAARGGDALDDRSLLRASVHACAKEHGIVCSANDNASY
jgi:hypothetical protein